MEKIKRAALYVRVSTDKQTVENQVQALTKAAEGRDWQVVETYSDAGISGSKGRKDRPGQNPFPPLPPGLLVGRGRACVLAARRAGGYPLPVRAGTVCSAL